jgi:signal transduction histidine kinase/ligand-binding sensor domain-containing protein
MAPFSSVSRAAMSDLTLEQLSHTSWTEANGGPSGLVALTQTTDGYLWLSTHSGLYRFDGSRFESLDSLYPGAALSPYVATVWADSSGGLWFSYKFGGVGFLKNNVLTNYKAGDGLPSATVRNFVEDPQHNVWISTTRGAAMFDGNHWRTLGEESGLKSQFTSHVMVDRNGSIWLSTMDSIWVLRPGAAKFADTGIRGRLPQVDESPDGTLMILLPKTGLRKLEDANSNHPRVGELVIDAPIGLAEFDRSGSLWAAGGDGAGLLRIRKPSADLRWNSEPGYIEKYDSANGLTGDDVDEVIEDREGNIWVGTPNGLDRFREVPFAHVEVPTHRLFFYVVKASDGKMWNAAEETCWLAVDGQTVALPASATPMLITDMYAGQQGSIWLGAAEGLWHLEHGKWSFLEPPSTLKSDYRPAHAIATDSNDNLWVSFLRGGVYRYSSGEWSVNGGRTDMLKETAIVIKEDPEHHLWFGYTDNRATFLDGSQVHNYSSKDGLAVGNVNAIHSSHGHTWVGGDNGLMIFDGNRFAPISPVPGKGLGPVSNIMELDDGEVWLNSGFGAERIPADEIKAYLADHTHKVRFDTFTYQDGLSGTTDALADPTIAQGADGRLWFATTSGIAWVNPTHVFRNEIKPPVWIQAITTNGKRFSALLGLSFPAGTTSMQFDYTALSLSIPERVQFRYKLEGQDADWTDAGNRRTAFFTNLLPGHYNFRVIASNNDGLWNTEGDSTEFTIAPRFVQTRWFTAICWALAAAVFYGLCWLRLRQVTGRITNRLQVRMTERERIARELHDTLLQSMQGLMFRFQAVADQLPEKSSVRQLMTDELNTADQVLIESRQTIKDIRGNEQTQAQLNDSLIVHGEALSKERSIKFAATVQGQPQLLHPVVLAEVRKIGQEAISNAFQHANASLVELELIYARTDFSMRIRDDGVGLRGTTHADARRPGHFGLLGMRERSDSINARLDIWSKPDAGVEVVLRVPASVAYRQPK